MTKQETPRGERGTRLLVVDDEPTQREMLSGILGRAGYRVETAPGGHDALEALGRDAFDLLLTDQKMPGMDGLALLDRAQALQPDLPVVLMTAYGSVSDAVAAMKKGAADYLTKPFEREELLLVLERVLKQRRLEEEVVTLRGALTERYRLDNIIGTSPAMREVFSLIERIATTDVPVLIRGESGTGKELVARAVHGRSRRASGPFVALNCAAVPETLLESEFFGHERGAFTVAVRAHPGRFEQAAGGTLFLDEIGAMRIDLQAKLLRAIQEKEIQRLGSTVTARVDVRILAATGENLEEAIRRKTFREDLFYRLSVVPLRLAPLRERTEDIPLLASHFLEKAAARFGKEPPAVSPEVMDRLQIHPWLGNVRELENCIERAVLLAKGQSIEMMHLPPSLQIKGQTEQARDTSKLGAVIGAQERSMIIEALKEARGNQSQAARLLGTTKRIVQYKIRKLGIDPAKFKTGKRTD